MAFASSSGPNTSNRYFRMKPYRSFKNIGGDNRELTLKGNTPHFDKSSVR
jgi:hypothetical protein